MPAVDVTAPEPLGLRPDLPPVVPNVLDVGIAPDPTSCHPERPSRAPAPSNDRRSGRSASVDGRWSARPSQINGSSKTSTCWTSQAARETLDVAQYTRHTAAHDPCDSSMSAAVATFAASTPSVRPRAYRSTSHPLASRTLIRASSADTSSDTIASTSTSDLTAAKHAVLSLVAGTKRGLRCDDTTRLAVEDAIVALERLNPTAVPASSSLQAGSWEVVYSTAPAPSNGALGPFRGVAFQDIDLEHGTYVNRLELPYNFLGANLNARWQRMGDPVDDSLWLVSFDDVTVSFFNNKLFTKTFADVTRVWDVTFLDENTRVVRAARTLGGLRKEKARGRAANAGEEDDCVFVMTRSQE